MFVKPHATRLLMQIIGIIAVTHAMQVVFHALVQPILHVRHVRVYNICLPMSLEGSVSQLVPRLDMCHLGQIV